MPSTTPAIITVAMSRWIPAAPISTKMKYSGARLGTMHSAAAPSDRHSTAMNRKICTKAPEKLFTCPLTSRSTWSANSRP